MTSHNNNNRIQSNVLIKKLIKMTRQTIIWRHFQFFIGNSWKLGTSIKNEYYRILFNNIRRYSTKYSNFDHFRIFFDQFSIRKSNTNTNIEILFETIRIWYSLRKPNISEQFIFEYGIRLSLLATFVATGTAK